MNIRWLIRRDMPAVMEIENQLQWRDSEDDIIDLLRNSKYIGMIAELDTPEHNIVGFMVYELHKNYLSIVKFAVHGRYRRFGIGTAMMRRLMDKLSVERRNRIEWSVPDECLDVHCFLRSLQFRAVAVVRNEFGHRDGYYFRYKVKEDSHACSY